MLSPGTANHGISNDIIFDWFRKLDNWNRIDFICGLLDLCHPFEIRYLGTFIEELGRKDYAALKTHEERANSEIKKEITNLKDPAVRSRLTISLTLLSSNNYKVASIIYDMLNQFMQRFLPELRVSISDSDRSAIQEYMLLLILAVSHPAFTIEQKEQLRNLFDTIRTHISFYQPPKPIGNRQPQIDNIHRTRQIDTQNRCKVTNTKLTKLAVQVSNCTTRMHGGEKQKLPPDELVLTIQIEWSDNRTNDVTRTLNEVSILERDMRHELLGMKKEDIVNDFEKFFNLFRDYNVPQFLDNPPQEVSDAITNFVGHLTQLPDDILNEMFMRRFLGRMDCRTEIRGSGLDTNSRSPSPELVEPTRKQEIAPNNEVFWWLRFHQLSDYYEHFKDYELNELLNLNEQDFRHSRFKNLDEWVKNRLIQLVCQTNRTTGGGKGNKNDIQDDDQEYESGDDEDYRRGHGKSPTGLSHSTSAPGNLAPGLYPKNTRSGDRNRNDESSDDSRSTNQQDSRPGSSREKDRGNNMIQNGPHQMYGKPQMGHHHNNVQFQNQNQQNQNPVVSQQIPMIPVSAANNYLNQAQAQAHAAMAEARARSLGLNMENVDQNGQPQFMHPPHGYIHAPQGMPLLPPPIMNQNGQIVSNYHRGFAPMLLNPNGPNGNTSFEMVQMHNQMQNLHMEQRPPFQGMFPHPPPGHMPVMQHPNQQMNQQQQQHQNQQQQQQAAQQQQAQQQQQQQQMNGPNAQFPFIHQQHHRQQNSKPKNKSCYLCGEQGHSAEHCSNEARADGNGQNNQGGQNNFSLKYAPNPNQNQNPLDRVVERERKPPEIDKQHNNTHEKRGNK